MKSNQVFNEMPRQIKLDGKDITKHKAVVTDSQSWLTVEYLPPELPRVSKRRCSVTSWYTLRGEGGKD